MSKKKTKFDSFTKKLFQNKAGFLCSLNSYLWNSSLLECPSPYLWGQCLPSHPVTWGFYFTYFFLFFKNCIRVISSKMLPLTPLPQCDLGVHTYPQVHGTLTLMAYLHTWLLTYCFLDCLLWLKDWDSGLYVTMSPCTLDLICAKKFLLTKWMMSCVLW